MIWDLLDVSRLERTMPNSDVLNTVQFRCAQNGCACVHPFQPARSLLWAANLGLVKPLGWQHYRLDDYEDAYFFDERHAGPAQIEFLIELFSAQCSPVIAGWWANGRKRRSRVKPNNLNRRHLRVQPLFPPGHDPVTVMPDYESSAGERQGYLFARGLKYFIIYGLVTQDPRFDWRLFLQPPDGLGLAGPRS
jgi:hypothetical protein